MRLNSLAFRQFIILAIWTLVILPVSGLWIYWSYLDDVQNEFDRNLMKLVDSAVADSMQGRAAPIPPVNRYEPLFEITHSGYYWQIKPLDGQNVPTLVSASLATGSLPSPFELKYPLDPETSTRWRNDVGPDGKNIRIVEKVDTLSHEPEAPRYSIAVAGPLDWLNGRISTYRNSLIMAYTLISLGLLAVTILQVRFGLRPLREVERGLARIRSGEASKLEGDLPTEIQPLQEEVNALIKSNQEIVDRARTQVGNLAHALKTPLAVITNEASEGDTSLANKVSEQAQIMRDQVNLYLDRARMAARKAVIGRVCNVSEAVAPLVRALERIHSDRSIKIDADCPSDAKFRGERQDIEEILGNLLDNACKWARSKVVLNVAVPSPAKQSTGRRYLTITVQDDGKGLTAEQRAKIGKRGVRLDEATPGTGLGLSIVIDLAQSYHGNVELDRSPLGGLLAKVTLPTV